MRQGSTLFLKLVVVLLGIAVLALCVLLLPATLSSGEADGFLPLLVVMYVTAIPFSYALYQTLKLLFYIDMSRAFSDLSVTALRNIKYCAIVIGALYAAVMPYIVHIADIDDAPGLTVLGLVVTLASIVIATFAAVLQKLLQEAVDIKSEHELTV